ncbi:MAG: TrmH family RNA methyltransferase, partial [Actinomycetota bacterium]
MALSSGLSLSNQHVQRLRRLVGRRSTRLEEGVLVIDGPTLVAEAVRAGLEVECQFVAPGADPVAGAGIVHLLAEGVLEKVSDTEAPRGVVAIAQRPRAHVDVLDRATFVVVAHGLSDPGNLGTLMRSAEAAGADALAITPGSVDATSPKVVRSSAGAVFHLPIVEIADLEALRSKGLRVIGTSSHQGAVFTRVDL